MSGCDRLAWFVPPFLWANKAITQAIVDAHITKGSAGALGVGIPGGEVQDGRVRGCSNFHFGGTSGEITDGYNRQQPYWCKHFHFGATNGCNNSITYTYVPLQIMWSKIHERIGTQRLASEMSKISVHSLCRMCDTISFSIILSMNE